MEAKTEKEKKKTRGRKKKNAMPWLSVRMFGAICSLARR